MKGKRNFKGLIAALLLTFTLMLSTAAVSYAEESEGGEETSIIEENEAVLGDNVENYTQNEENTEKNVGDIESTNKNIFAQIYRELGNYAAEIISTVTLVLTLVLSIAYKKGLLPLVTKAVSAIQKAVTKIKDDTESNAMSTQSGLDRVSERLGEMENSLTLFKGTLDSLEEKLLCEEEYISERRKMGSVMLSQIDMLYDIFMASALPQYQKDAVGARVQMMKEELELYDKITEK